MPSAKFASTGGLNLWLEAGLYMLFTMGSFSFASWVLQRHE